MVLDNWTTTSIKETMKVDTHLIPLTKRNQKWIRDINVKYQNYKSLGDNIGGNADDLACAYTL